MLVFFEFECVFKLLQRSFVFEIQGVVGFGLPISSSGSGFRLSLRISVQESGFHQSPLTGDFTIRIGMFFFLFDNHCQHFLEEFSTFVFNVCLTSISNI